MAEEAKDNPATEEGAEEKPKKKKIMLFGIIGVVLLLVAGGGFFVYTKLMTPEPAINEETLKKEAEAAVGEMFELEPFVVNLSDPKGKRYLKVKITIEIDSVEMVDRVTKAVPKMRDMVIMMLTSLTFEEVMTPEGKIRVRDELYERFNLILRPDRVKNIYFTEFVIQ